MIVRNRIVTAVIWLVGLALFGCGVKGPPTPPRQPPVPAVVDLAHEISDAVATLTWALAEPLSKLDAKDAAFLLYRSRSLISSDSCEDCPQLFEKVIAIPYVDQPSGRYEERVSLTPGYRYLFKVRLETKNGIGPDSDTIGFNFPKQDNSGDAAKQ